MQTHTQLLQELVAGQARIEGKLDTLISALTVEDVLDSKPPAPSGEGGQGGAGPRQADGR
jgi:hypothetical protein